jgi:DNA polymerase-3 subunit gamma/tau
MCIRDRTITHDDVIEVLGIVNNQHLFKLSEAVLKEDAGGAIRIINEIAAGGKDISQFIRDLMILYRNLLMTKVVSKCEDVIDMSKEGIQQLKRQSEDYDKNNIIRCISILSELESEAKWSVNPRILLEVALVKMCRTGMDKSLDGLLTRISKLEDIIAKTSFSLKAAERTQTADIDARVESKAKKKEALPVQAQVNEESDLKSEKEDIIKKWPGFIQEIKGRGKIRLRTYLSMAKPVKVESGTIVLSYEKEGIFSKEALELPANRAEVEEAASQYFNTPLKVKCIVSGEVKEEEQDNIVRAAVELVGMDNIEVIEEE